MKSKEYTLDEIGKNIDKLTQLHELTSIETISVTVLVATFILGITLCITSPDLLWRIISSFIILFTTSPLILFIKTFLLDAGKRVRTIENILFLLSLDLILIGVTFLMIWIVVFFNLESNLGPLLVVIIFVLWAIFAYFWINDFKPKIRDKFSHLIIEKEIKGKIIKNFNVIFRKSLLLLTILLFPSVVIWCLLINENIQAIIISVIGTIIGTIDIIYLKTKGKNKKRKKWG